MSMYQSLFNLSYISTSTQLFSLILENPNLARHSIITGRRRLIRIFVNERKQEMTCTEI